MSLALSRRIQAWLFVDSVYPVQLGRWDFRHYFGRLRSPSLLSDLQDRLNRLSTHNFRLLAVEPQPKDGGVFVKFSYTPSNEPVEQAIRDQLRKHGSLPSWTGLGEGNVWLVKGTPWKEDLSRFASPILKVTFEGPDVHEQKLYQLFRPYGRIYDLSAPGPVPSGSLRSATLRFSRPLSSAIARNVLHSFNVDGTVIRLSYLKPIQAHAVRDWFGSHPRFTIPLIIFLLGSLTYTIFDPIRSLMVQGKLENWFDYQEYKLYQWLRRNALDYFHDTAPVSEVATAEEGWKERLEAKKAIKAYLTDTPSTIAFVHGPQGSGKYALIEPLVSKLDRTVLVIDCNVLLKASSDSQIVGALARQTGYWPMYTFLNSMSSLIDLASVGLIGQKTGIVSSLSDEMQQVLTVVGTALQRVYASRRRDAQKNALEELRVSEAEEEMRLRQRKIMNGTWHDGRMDCVAGNGVMSELGMGDEPWDANDIGIDEEKDIQSEKQQSASQQGDQDARKRKAEFDTEAISALPIVIIRNFDSRAISGIGLTATPNSREKILNTLAQWAGTLAENQVAHVIVISDNRENSRRLAKAIVSKPLNSIALYDADPASSLAFVKQKLGDNANVAFTEDEVQCLQRLGGRASDLESVIHKVRNGQSVQVAVEEIISRAVSELRNSAFGDDVDDGQGKPWTRDQAWTVVKALSTKSEVSYYDILINFPFKGNEDALRGMENAELITIGTFEGRPSVIRPGKPVFRWAFEHLAKDDIFRVTQEIGIHEKQLSALDTTIHKYEDELVQLKNVEDLDGGWLDWLTGRRRSIRERERFLLRKLGEASRRVDELERKNRELKGVLKRVL
ncbi:hypothetical protein Agabi119p4_3245 [Agaricus bisporus var. burnettii]|uniref:Mitochondrial escape protein 2 n=1 Tax=Agaricus bisporus var. burnettii TaxID=192524 RepID=A0A8H7F6U9_AGABI|nr:hypothetical protein Agabi119p4_3245 [Agaricus bisporus var. burnettii]